MFSSLDMALGLIVLVVIVASLGWSISMLNAVNASASEMKKLRELFERDAKRGFK